MMSSLLGSSSNFAALQLTPVLICATEPRFCLAGPVTLTLREKSFSWSGDDFKISCAATGETYFKCQGRAWSLREKKVLLDNHGTPVANFKERFFSFTNEFSIYAGQRSETKIGVCEATYTFVKSKLLTHFRDVQSGRQKLVVLKGNWRDKKCVIYLGEPKQGGIPIAKIFRPLSLRSQLLGKDKYYLEVAAGVDIALMVIICIAFDEHVRVRD